MVDRRILRHTCDSPKHPFRQDILRHTPVLLEDSLSDDNNLCPQRHSKLRILIVVVCSVSLATAMLLVELVNLLLDLVDFIARFPDFVPILPLTRGASIDNLKHKLGRVLLVITLSRAVTLKVVEKSPRVLANRAEVDSLSSLCQEQESVEFLEENSARLMDSAENGLSSIGELAEESANRPSRLTVETGGRFVQEKQ